MYSVTIEASAPGKLILTGEHAVVHGKLAVAGALDLRTHVVLRVSPHSHFQLDITAPDQQFSFSLEETRAKQGEASVPGIVAFLVLSQVPEPGNVRVEYSVTSRVPLASGLGSSASLCVASAAVILKWAKGDDEVSLAEINELAFRGEKIIHGNPSGIDNTVITYGGIVRYKQQNFEMIPLSSPLPVLVVNSNTAKNTKAMVEKVRLRHVILPHTMDAVFNAVDQLSEDFVESLKKGDTSAMEELVDINHGLCWSMGVVTPVLGQILNCGYRHAIKGKMTGGGGGGCCFFLVAHGVPEGLLTDLAAAGFEPIQTTLTSTGVLFHS